MESIPDSSLHFYPYQRKNVRLETIKLLKENLGSKLPDISLGDNFLDLTPKATVNKRDYTKAKRSCTAREARTEKRACGAGEETCKPRI